MIRNYFAIILLLVDVFVSNVVVAADAAPTILSITPIDGATEIARDANIVITFDQAVYQGQTANATLTLINYTDPQAPTAEKLLSPASPEITGWGTETITIDFGSWLYNELSDYYIYSYNGVFENVSGESYDIPDQTAIFKTTGIPPAIVNTTPSDGATNQSINLGSYVLTASEDLQIASSPGTAGTDYFLEIRYSSNTIILKSFDVTNTSDVEVSGNQITLKNIPTLSPGVTYSVRYFGYISSPFEDLDGYKLPNYNNSTAFTFTTDGTPPTVSNTLPSDEGTFAYLNGTGNITLNEDVVLGTGSIKLYKTAGNTLIETIDVDPAATDTRVSQQTTRRIAWDFDADLESLTEYYILISAGSFVDLNGNQFAGLAYGDLNFISNQRPQISTLSPLDGATDVAVDASLEIDFDMDMYAPDPCTLVLKRYVDDQVIETFDLSNMGSSGEFVNGTITLTPTSDLPANTRMYVVADPVGSLEANSNTENFLGLDDKDDWDFTTAAPDLIAPEISSITEIDDGSYNNYTLVFTITFNEDINVNDAFNHFKLGIVSPAVTYNLSSAITETTSNSITFSFPGLVNGWTYYILIDPSAITDLAGNAFAGITANTDYRFLVSWDAPEVLSRTPLATGNQAIDTDILLAFDEAIKLNGAFDPANTAIRINRGSDNGIVEAYTTADIEVDGSTLTINRSSELDLGSTYFIYIPRGLIMAAADTSRFFDGYISTTSWRFTTEYNFWDGSQWKNGIPAVGDDITLKANYDFSQDELLDVGAVTVNEGVTLTIESDATLRHTGYFANYGTVILESGSSLNSQAQFESLNGGSLIVRRSTTGGPSDGAYSFIGVPFYNIDFSSLTGAHKYQYNQTDNSYSDASGITNMIVGRGYTIANNDFLEIEGINPVVGDISIGVQKSSPSTGFNLLSNPYTAAISYDALMAAEGPNGLGNITGTIYLWDDAGNASKSQSEFITINSIGSVSGGSGRSNDFNGHIGVGQGFFVESMKANANLTFTNAMKVNGNNTDQSFFRTTGSESQRLKLSLTSNDGVVSQILVGWREDAQVGYDPLYDARKLVGNRESYLYMPCEDYKLSIQGVPANYFAPIQIGLDAKQTGEYSIQMVDSNLDAEVFLHDKATGKLHDIHLSAYHFYTSLGDIDDRFELLVKSGRILALDAPQNWRVHAKDGQISLFGLESNEDIDYLIYNVTGQLIRKGIFQNGETTIHADGLVAGYYLLHIGGQVVKFIYE